MEVCAVGLMMLQEQKKDKFVNKCGKENSKGTI